MEAATKKHEAIETDIKAYEERVNAVVLVATELARENYHDIDRIQQRKSGVLQLWQDLLDLLAKRRKRLELALQLHKVNTSTQLHIFLYVFLFRMSDILKKEVGKLGRVAYFVLNYLICV